MPRPRAPFVLDIHYPLSLDEALKRHFAERGFEFANAIKESKVKARVMFQTENESYWYFDAEIPLTWKTNDEHDDMLYDAIVKALDEWVKNRRCRGFQIMARNMAALIPKLPGGTPGISDFGRAGGDTICPKCGLKYVEHPTGLEEFLHLLCDGKQVKL